MLATGEVHEPARSWLPWLTHLLAAVSLFPWLVSTQIRTYGLDRTGEWSLSEPIAVGIMVAAVVLAAPFAAVEGWAARRHRRRWLARAAAVVGTSVVGWFASLPVGLRFFASTDPVTQGDVESAVSAYLILLASYLALVVACRSIRRPLRLRPRRARA